MANRHVAPHGSNQHAFTVLDDPQAVAEHAAAWLAEMLDTGAQSRKAVCLSGGQTPRLLYQTLAEPRYVAALPWPRVHWFWSDERWVAPSHERSNYGMAQRALLAHAPVAGQNVHPIPTHAANPLQASELYENELQTYYGGTVLEPARPLFDVTFLGVGEDGHTASLFPGSEVLRERARWVRAVLDAAEPRITLTLPAIESSAELVFLVTGAAKRNIMKAIAERSRDLPVSCVHPVGRVHWLVDRAAVEDR